MKSVLPAVNNPWPQTMAPRRPMIAGGRVWQRPVGPVPTSPGTMGMSSDEPGLAAADVALAPVGAVRRFAVHGQDHRKGRMAVQDGPVPAVQVDVGVGHQFAGGGDAGAGGAVQGTGVDAAGEFVQGAAGLADIDRVAQAAGDIAEIGVHQPVGHGMAARLDHRGDDLVLAW